MFKNIGKKIQMLAKGVCAIGIVISIIVASIFSFILENELGMIIVLVGPITSFISSCLLYGFGQLIDDIHIIASNYENKDNHNYIDRLTFLNQLREEGLITKEDVEQKVRELL